MKEAGLSSENICLPVLFLGEKLYEERNDFSLIKPHNKYEHWKIMT